MSAQVTLPSDQEVRVMRSFKAPRQVVWEAHTKPELLYKWQGGYGGWDMSRCEMDLRVGGRYHWEWTNREEGKKFGFFGTFTQVEQSSRLSHEQYFDPGQTDFSMPVTDPCIVSLDFSEKNGVTTLISNMKYASKEARDNAISTGMTDGMEFGYSSLDKLLAANSA